MTIALVVIHVIVCFVLILVILLQAGRGQGLSGPAFGSGNVQSLFGTRANDFLTKATSVSAICFLFTCISLCYLETQKSKSLLEMKKPAAALDMETIRKALEKVKSEQAAKEASAPGQEAGAPATAAGENLPTLDSSTAASTASPVAGETKTEPTAEAGPAEVQPPQAPPAPNEPSAAK